MIRTELPTELGLVWLGTRPYRQTTDAQERLVDLRRRNEIGDLLLLLEHPSVYTLGRRTGSGDLLHDREFYEAHGIAVEPTPRGGRVTYHGPGQLVAYPILDLAGVPGPAGRVGVARFVESLEAAVVRALRRWRVAVGRIEGLTGLWADESGILPVDATTDSTAVGVGSGRIRKIASIGLRISQGVTSHGVSINVDCDLAPFGWINSCGIEHCAVTSVAAEIERSPRTAGDRSGPGTAARSVPAPEAVGIAFAEELAEILGRDLEPVDPASLELEAGLPAPGRAKA